MPRGVSHQLELLLRRIPAHLLLRAGRPVRVQAWQGWAEGGRAHVGGRVLVQATPLPRSGRASTWQALRANLSSFITFEVAYAQVRIELGGRSTAVTADREGYLDAVLHHVALAPGRHPVTLTPTEPAGKPATSTVHVADPAADLAVVSDIDDTVVDSGVARGLVATVATALLRDSTTRVPLEGVPVLYQALARDPSNGATRPFFYLSTSPWNLAGFLRDFLSRHGLPGGPLMLTDWGLGRRGLVRGGPAYKLSNLRRLADELSGSRFVLLGDSGQEDAAIYTSFALDHPGRVAAIYIRSAGSASERKRQHLEDCARRLTEAGIPYLMADTSAEMLDHARGLGLAQVATAGRLSHPAPRRPSP